MNAGKKGYRGTLQNFQYETVFCAYILIKPAAGAGLTGSKMARRTGSVDEFEFKAIGENHNQGVSSLACIIQLRAPSHLKTFQNRIAKIQCLNCFTCAYVSIWKRRNLELVFLPPFLMCNASL